MAAPRFLVSDTLLIGKTIALPPAASHHALRVLRLRARDAIVLFDGAGGEFQAVLVPDPGGGPHWQATITGGGPVDREARLRITIVQALSAQEKIDWFVEKAVELGADRIVLASSVRSVVRLAAARRQRRLERWREIAAGACAQSGRNRLPAIDLADDLAAALGAARHASACWLLEPNAPSGLARAPGGSVAIAVGPEGGFTGEEVALAHSLGFVSARLGQRILRTETAALAAVSALLALDGEFS
jgi:16S rRNA (uracil1498-N3)-methyltransferase